jgi:hypothetical protein
MPEGIITYYCTHCGKETEQLGLCDECFEKSIRDIKRRERKQRRLLKDHHYVPADVHICLTCRKASRMSCEDTLECTIADDAQVNECGVCGLWE